MPTASIKYTQGATTDLAGRALQGVAGAAVNVTNGNDTGVTSWAYTVLDVPEGSTVPEGPLAVVAGAATFTPDVPGTYQVKLVVNGNPTLFDVRDFVVPEASGDLIPGYLSDETTFNLGGQGKGYKTAVNRILRKAASGVSAPTVVVNSTSGTRPALADLVIQTLVHKATASTTYPLPVTPVDGAVVDFERASAGTGAVTLSTGVGGRNIENGTTSASSFGPSTTLIGARLTYRAADNVWRVS